MGAEKQKEPTAQEQVVQTAAARLSVKAF